MAAPNPDARKIAGDALNGVYYMAPDYDRDNPRMKEFVEKYQADHGHPPAIPFHSAGTVDSLDLLQAYLDSHSVFNREEFADWLLTHVKDYPGLMGTYSLDADGNTNLGFSMAQIGPENNGAMK